MHLIRHVSLNTALYSQVLNVSDVLNQNKYLIKDYPNATQRVLLQ
jgi:hypothetical protein